jgi:hypothetical protein
MSILGNMFSRILGRGRQPPPGAMGGNVRAQASGPAPTPAPGQTTTPAQAAVPRMDEVDVAKLLDDLAGQQKQKLNWRESIVDLMKLLGMSSSLAERKELAKELGYSGDTKDSARMNIWLHQQVLRKMADNGGRVPQDLLH